MKFKVLFAVFNAVVVGSFLLIFFMPTFVLGWDYTHVFWSRNWPIGIVFAAILATLNVYFVSNWQVFGFLEREDWDCLVSYLERRLELKRRVSRQRIRLLINAYVVTGAAEKITELEASLRTSRPAWIPTLAVEFGIPHLLKNDPVDMERFFGEMKADPKCNEVLWIRWNYAFALMLQRRLDEAKGELVAIADEVKNAVQELLTAYLLDTFGSGDSEMRSRVTIMKDRIRKRFPRSQWDRELVRSRTNLQVLVLSKLLKDASTWLYQENEEKNG